MPDLSDIMNKMLADVRSGKCKREATTARKKKRILDVNEKAALRAKRLEELLGTTFTGPAPLPITSPWFNESIVLFIHNSTCACGSVHSYPSDHIFIKRVREISSRKSGLHRTPARTDADYQRIASPNIYAMHAELPRTIEHRATHVDFCPDCFCPDSMPYRPFQANFNFTFPQEKENAHH